MDRVDRVDRVDGMDWMDGMVSRAGDSQIGVLVLVWVSCWGAGGGRVGRGVELEGGGYAHSVREREL